MITLYSMKYRRDITKPDSEVMFDVEVVKNGDHFGYQRAFEYDEFAALFDQVIDGMKEKLRNTLNVHHAIDRAENPRVQARGND